MEVDEKLIRHVASLARLDLTDAEVEKFTPQLKEIIDLFSTLSEVNTEGVLPSFQPIRMRDALRDDETGVCLTQEQALENAVHKKDGYFLGPKAV